MPATSPNARAPAAAAAAAAATCSPSTSYVESRTGTHLSVGSTFVETGFKFPPPGIPPNCNRRPTSNTCGQVFFSLRRGAAPRKSPRHRSPSPPLPRAAGPATWTTSRTALIVRLRSRAYVTFLCADEDGRGVSLDPHSASLNAAWAVHLLVRDGVPYSLLLLRSAAYGRYLATSEEPAPMGLRGYLAEQMDYDHPEEYAIMWLPLPSSSGHDVVLHNMYRRGHLRASDYLNGAAVTVDTRDDVSAPMDWSVGSSLRERY
ncbi:uncharacterized protein C2845_PM13G26050 [Panicum miliaceum]|uniref:DUF569 domain-containing protein n=1 Tax=Panicum miliaceum TaxID=4540 RepID=A0A3L6RL05_PANMI|nr:uncharacterized protein C2845_PM13G26050 [Panicum miliaceum]